MVVQTNDRTHGRLRLRCGLLLCLTLAFCLLGVAPARATVIDIMIVFDSKAKTWVDLNGGTEVFASDVVARMNQATQNSNIDLTFNLVHAAAVNYTSAANLYTDLNNLTNGAGTLADVHQWRNTYGADVVSMLVDNGPFSGSYTAGLGWLLSSMSGSPANAFTVCEARPVALDHTLTHEVGHNLGADHSKFQTSAPGPNSALNSYSAGWYFSGALGARYHTIMAYGSDGYGYTYTEVPYFSTPLRSYDGTAVGHALDGDNARTIAETMNVVAGYRAGIGCEMPASLTVPATDVDGSYSINWGASATPGVSYVLEEATNNTFSASRGVIYSGTATSFTVTGRSPGKTYYYRVKATKAGINASAWRTAGNGCAIPDPLLGNAVDNSSLVWTSGGDAPWHGQTLTAFSGGDAAESGSISDSQSSYLQTTVTGPGTLAYYWKVSSESGYDYLSFSIDGVLQERISGTAGWTQKSVSLSAGSHALRWEYSKDESYDSGSDRGWVDAVTWTPLPQPSCAIPSSLAVPVADVDGAYTVTWGASTTAGVSYVLQEATNPNFTAGLRVAYSGTARSAAITGRLLNKTYYYRVKAIRAGYKDSAYQVGASGCAVPGSAAVTVPASITVPVSDVDGSYTVTWGASATAGVVYVLQEATNPTFTAGLRTAYLGTLRTVNITGRLQNRTYYYRVRAIKAGLKDSVWRIPVKGCAVPGTASVAVPASISVPASDPDGAYAVSWPASGSPGVSYFLQEATNSAFTAGLRTAYFGAGLSANITGRMAGKTYYYRVQAVKAGNVDSGKRVGSNGCQVGL